MDPGRMKLRQPSMCNGLRVPGRKATDWAECDDDSEAQFRNKLSTLSVIEALAHG